MELAKPNTKVLVNKEKYPYKDQVWLATEHGPWPDYLKNKVHKGDFACKCGIYEAKWQHLAECKEFGKIDKIQEEWTKPGFAAAIVKRGFEVTHPERRRSVAAIPLPSISESSDSEISE